MTAHAFWEHSLAHLKPELSKALSRPEAHPEFQTLFLGLGRAAQYRGGQSASSTIGHLRETINRAISTTSKLQKLIDGLKTDEAEGIDQLYAVAFNEFATRDLDFMPPFIERRRSDPKMGSYLMELQDCDEGRAGITIMLENLARAMELQRDAMPQSGRGKNRDSHPHLGCLVKLAEVVDGLGWSITTKKSSVYYRYCAFFLSRVVGSDTADPTRQIAEAIRLFKLIPDGETFD